MPDARLRKLCFHSPRERSRFDDCARGAGVLLHTVLALAS